MKKLMGLLLAAGLMLLAAEPVTAEAKRGIHLLDVNELAQAKDLTRNGAVTVVLQSNDRNLNKWQQFFDETAKQNTLPIVRLATEPQGDTWRRPEKKDIVEAALFLSFLNWQRDSLPVVIYNEPNHAQEWGGRVSPEEYAEILEFAADWFHTEPKKYVVLPAGLDAAAADDNLQFIEQILADRPKLVDKIDGLAAHAYPNPAFAGSPTATHKAGVRSFEYELRAWEKDLDVYITETGWALNNETLVAEYYDWALKNVWNSEKIKAITPFVLNAQSGPFLAFSWIKADGSIKAFANNWLGQQPVP